MSKEESLAYLGIMRRRYEAVRRKKGLGQGLDEFCGLTGLSRKHAIKALSPKRPAPGKRGCPPGDTREGTTLLERVWRLSDMMCGKILGGPARAAVESDAARGGAGGGCPGGPADESGHGRPPTE